MSNPLKYTTSTPTGALRHATLGAGVANGEYDSTWRSGITPYTLTSYYLVYEPDSGGEVRVYAPADAAELIQLAQSKGSSETTEAGALTWLSSNGFYPANKVLDNIVTDGLVLLLDSTTATSYPRSGTDWLDLSGEANDGTLINGPTFNSNGAIDFDGVDDVVNTSYTAQLGDFTVTVLFKSDGNGIGWARLVDKGYQTGFFISSYFATSGAGYVGCGIIEPSVPHGIALQYDTSKWHSFTSVRSGTTQTIYLDGILNTNTKTVSSATLNSTTVSIGAWSGNGSSQRFKGGISQALMYDKALTPTEILQNYYQGPIVTDDLTFAIDASNLVSWGGTGNTLNNLISSTAYPTIALYGDTANYGSIGNGYVTLGGANNNTNQGTILRGTGNMGTTVNNDFTTMGWQRRTSYVRSSGEILEYRGAWQRCSFDVGNGYMGFYQRETVAPYSTNATSTSISNSTLNEWNHFAVVKTSSTMSFYMNGKLIATNSYTLSETITGTSFSIGAAWSDDDYLSNGMDGDVGLTLHYTRALTADEVAQNYNANIKRYT